MVDIEKLEQELTQAASIEEMQEILKANGVEMTAAEMQKILDEATPQGELTDEDLDTVAGGSWLTPIEEILRRMRERIRRGQRAW